jgi:peptide/nickel transport system substrate-binding protein
MTTSIRRSAAACLCAALIALVGCTSGGSSESKGEKDTWAAQVGTLKFVHAEVPAKPPKNVAAGTKYVITVNLTPGVKWSDGTPLTAQDFVGMWNVKWAQEDTNWQSLTDVKATSGTQLVYETRDLSPNLLQQLLQWNQPAPSSQFGNIYDTLGQLRAQGAKPSDPKVKAALNKLDAMKPHQAVGYGPYVIDPSSVTAQQLRMVKNKGGFNADKIHFDHVDVYWGQTQQDVPLLLQNQLDYTTDALAPADVKAVTASRPNIQLIRTPLSTGTGVWFNETIKPFGDARFRQAIAYIIDRQRNATVSLGTAAKPIKYMVGFSDTYVPGWLSHDVVGKLHTYQRNPERAAQLLEQAGLSKKGGNWTYNGKRFGFEITAPSDFPDFLASAKDVSAQLNNFGFNTHVRGIPAASRPDVIKLGRYQAMLDFSMVSTPPHPATSLDWNMAEGFFGTNNPAASGAKGLDWPWRQKAPDGTEVYIPDLLKKAVAGVDKAPQQSAVETLAQIFNDQLPVVPIFERYTTDPIAHGPRVTGWLPADNPIYKNNQGSDNYVSIQFLDGVLRPAQGADGSFHTSAPYAQPPNYSLNYYGANSIYITMTSPSYDIQFPPMFWYAEAIHAYIPEVGKSYSVAEVH